jgi:PAS domain S-box-containing protein
MHDFTSIEGDLDYRLIFESSPDLYLILNAKLEIVAVSNAYASATLTRREEILGKSMFQVFPDNPDDPTAEGVRNLRASLQRVLQSGKSDTMPVQKYDIRRPDGEGFEERYWSPKNIPILGKDGRVTYIIHRAEDLTDYISIKQLGVEQSQLNETLRAQAVKMEVELFARTHEIASASAELKAANEELSRLYAKTLELDELKTQFFANVSHEFRTPLTLMLGPLEELQARFAPIGEKPAVPEYEQLTLVHRNSLRLLKLVNTLLDFSRIEAGRMAAAYEATDLAAFTAELASVFRSATDKAGLKLKVSCPALPEPVYVDRQMWEKIVINLLSNAYKHTFEGEIEVALRWCGKQVELAVRDTGVGIAEDQVEHVFDRFHRVENVRSRSHEGTGIGLALVLELTRLHGGEVKVTSKPGVGTSFTVTIPSGIAHLPSEYIHPSQVLNSQWVRSDFFVDEASRWELGAENENDKGKQIGTDKTQALTVSRGAHIILADDNVDMRNYVARLLREQGYAVTAIRDGEEALAAVREHHPDLVLSDIMMPRLDGFGLLSALREDHQSSTIPIILLSARAGEEARIEGLQQGADDYLTKPFTARELLARVGACLEMSRLRKAADTQLRILENEREFRALAEMMPQIVWVTRPDGWNIYHNQRWVDYTGLTLEESYGHAWLSALHPDDKQRAGDAWQRATPQNEIYSLECRLRRADGAYRWWLIRGVPRLNEQGIIQKWYGTNTDIHDLKQNEENIKYVSNNLQAALNEKEVLLKEVYHRVKNNLQVVSSLINLQARPVKNEEAKGLLKQSADRIKAMALVHEKLYQSRDLAKIDFGDYIGSLVDSLLYGFGITSNQVKLSTDIKGIILGIDRAIPCGLIINEVLSNALKYAFPPGQQGIIDISFTHDQNEYKLVVSDNGVGLPDGFDIYKSKTLGLQLVTGLAINQLEGQINLDKNKGTSITIHFPYEEPLTNRLDTDLSFDQSL